MSLSTRGRVAPFHVMEVIKAALARQAQGADVIMLCVGQPATSAPTPVREAAVRAIQHEVLGYTEAVGTLQLRARIAQHYTERYRIEVTAEDVLVTTGSSGGFLLAVLAAFDAGDTVAMTRPGYPAYRNDLTSLGCRVLDLDVGPRTRYQPTVAMLEALPEPPRGLIVASPANPTGTIIEPAELAALARWCARHDCLLISDEIYHGISYGRRCASAWEYERDHAVVVGSVSKYYSMTGWRLGWLLLPPLLRRPVELLQGNLAICAPAISQAAAVAAFGPAATRELDGHVAHYRRNREVLLARLPELGISELAPPDGAFYAYFDVSHLTEDSQSWCAEVLESTGVALAPGIDFDPVNGNRMARLSFCGDTGELHRAIDRLARHLNR